MNITSHPINGDDTVLIDAPEQNVYANIQIVGPRAEPEIFIDLYESLVEATAANNPIRTLRLEPHHVEKIVEILYG